MTILIVEDDARIVGFLEKGLAAEGYATEVAVDGDAALQAVEGGLPDVDLVLLDLGLPGASGEAVLAAIRSGTPELPVIVLTARAEVEDKVRGLNLGANDYVTKPFSFDELVARVRAAMRTRAQLSPTRLAVEDLELDLLTKVATRADRRIELTHREWTLLELFMRHPTDLLSRAQIASEVFGYDFETGSNVADVYVGYLRRKLNGPGESQFIRTVRGAGYRFVDTI